MSIATDEIHEVKTKPRKRVARNDQEASEMQKIANLPVKVKAFGQEYEVAKFSLVQIARALTHIGPLQYAVQQLADRGTQLSRGEIAGVILASLSISGESIIGLVSIATSEPVEWIEQQNDPIGAMEILTAVVEKNADFFSHENIERVKGLFGRLQQAIPALSGLTSTP